MSLTTDPNDPRLGRGVDEKPIGQHEVYLVLSDEERAKGFVRNVRRSYKHVGAAGPEYPLQDLTDEQNKRYEGCGYIKFEKYPDGSAAIGRYWTEKQLAEVGNGCQSVTTMGQALAETYARDPKFYGATYCCHCQKHLAVEEFVWEGTNEKVGS